MRPRVALLALLVCLVASAQMSLNVKQLVSWVQSSIELKHEDRKIADLLRKVKLTERLTDSTIEDLQGLGAGPKTLEALRSLRDASKKLKAAPAAAPAPKPKAVTIPAPGEAEQSQILDQVREYAQNYTKRLPDFICTQVTRRSVDPSGTENWVPEDTIMAKLTYFEQKEDYKLIMVGNHATDMKYDQLGGASSSGEFGSLLREVFAPASHAQFRWQRWATLRGKRMHVFSYRVAQPFSKWHVVFERKQDITPGYRGLIYVDSSNQMVMRVTLEAEDLPPTFPIQDARTKLDYDYVTISAQEYVLPLRAEIRMRQGKYLSKNEIEFRMYRKFGAETSITFDTPPPLPAEKTQEQPVKP
jgi:hypothetical protein